MNRDCNILLINVEKNILVYKLVYQLDENVMLIEEGE
jgi:hypothetical protein